MGIQVGNYNLEGPFLSTNDLRAQSGVYVIIGRNSDAERWVVVDVGESENTRERVARHDRAEDWKKRGHGRLAAAVYYCDEGTRMQVERQLRAQYNPPCGER